MRNYLLMLVLMLAIPALYAQEDAQEASAGEGTAETPEFADAPEPPTLPPQVQSGEALEPEVTIRETDEGMVEEYRVSGQLYMVKVTPSVGPAYYLIDTDGDGKMDAREDDITKSNVPQWVLFSW